MSFLFLASLLNSSVYAALPLHFSQRLSTETSLGLSDSELKDADIPAILAYLNKHPEIKSLNLQNNQISDAGVSEIAKNTTLTELDLGHNHNQSCKSEACIGDEGAKALANNTDYSHALINAEK